MSHCDHPIFGITHIFIYQFISIRYEMRRLSLQIVCAACFIINLAVIAAQGFDDPPALPAGFIAKATWQEYRLRNGLNNATGYGTAYMNGPAGEFRIIGTTQWSNGQLYDSDGLFLCGSTEQFYPSWTMVFPPTNPPVTYCGDVPFATVVGACAALGKGQLPKAGYLRTTVYYGQPSTAYVYPFLFV